MVHAPRVSVLVAVLLAVLVFRSSVTPAPQAPLASLAHIGSPSSESPLHGRSVSLSLAPRFSFAIFSPECGQARPVSQSPPRASCAALEPRMVSTFSKGYLKR